MKHCEVYSDLIPLHITGDLSRKDRVKVRKHLPECESCRQAEYELSRIHSAIRTDKIEIHPAYGGELVVKINNRMEKHRKFIRRLLWGIPAIVTTVILVVLAVSIFRNEAPSSDSFQAEFEDTYFIHDLTNSGYFGEISPVLNDSLGTEDLEDSVKDLFTDIVLYVLNKESAPSVDEYLLATSSLDDEEFDVFFEDMKKIGL